MALVTRGNNMCLLRGGRVQALIMPGKPREFTPDQLFLAMRGAWLEPTPGYIWQENTGITPTTTGGQTLGRIADQSGGGNTASQATAANRPTYQLDSNNLPLARHDTTDSLVVSLPSINVRRNLLTYSEDFTNGVWVRQATGTGSAPVVTANAAIAPDGAQTADRLQFTLGSGSTASDTSRIYQAITFVNTLYCYSIYLKTNDSSSRTFRIRLTTGVSSNITVTPSWNRFSLSGVVAGGGSALDLTFLGGTGADSADISVWGAQLELGSVATDYQRVTDWTSEAYSSNGSVYYATPQGMQALHNQSMGLTYTLPAPSTDIYSWMVFPQRLSVEDESNLAIYMASKAGI